MRPVLVLRPEPGAGATIRAATALGLAAVAAPLFHLRALAWDVSAPSRFDALMLTSANAVRLGGADLARCRSLPVYAVGAATASAARRAGIAPVWEGAGDAERLVRQAAAAGRRRLLHLCGREHRAVSVPGVSIEAVPVYAAHAVTSLPAEAEAAIACGAVALLHSPRAAAVFRRLLDAAGRDPRTIAAAALSSAVAIAAGPGWRRLAVAERPGDEALLAAACRLCEEAAMAEANRS